MNWALAHLNRNGKKGEVDRLGQTRRVGSPLISYETSHFSSHARQKEMGLLPHLTQDDTGRSGCTLAFDRYTKSKGAVAGHI